MFPIELLCSTLDFVVTLRCVQTDLGRQYEKSVAVTIEDFVRIILLHQNPFAQIFICNIDHVVFWTSPGWTVPPGRESGCF